MLIEAAAIHINRMQKALVQMNLHLKNAISDITGVTGMAIVKSIIQGETDPNKLAQMRDPRCKQPIEVIKKSLQGNYRKEHVFALKQGLEAYEFYQSQIKECEEAIKKKVETLSPLKTSEDQKPSRRKLRKYEYSFQVGKHLKQLVGTDLTTVPGIDASTALKLISEIGTDINRWPTAKHFCAWLGLCPGTRISGGKYLSSHTSHSSNKAATSLRMAVSGLYRSNTTLGAHLRRMKARMGPVQAITATAHKMARSIYYMMQRQADYVESGGDYYDKLNEQKTIKYMMKRAKSLGYRLEKNVA